MAWTAMTLDWRGGGVKIKRKVRWLNSWLIEHHWSMMRLFQLYSFRFIPDQYHQKHMTHPDSIIISKPVCCEVQFFWRSMVRLQALNSSKQYTNCTLTLNNCLLIRRLSQDNQMTSFDWIFKRLFTRHKLHVILNEKILFFC